MGASILRVRPPGRARHFAPMMQARTVLGSSWRGARGSWPSGVALSFIVSMDRILAFSGANVCGLSLPK